MGIELVAFTLYARKKYVVFCSAPFGFIANPYSTTAFFGGSNVLVDVASSLCVPHPFPDPPEHVSASVNVDEAIPPLSAPPPSM